MVSFGFDPKRHVIVRGVTTTQMETEGAEEIAPKKGTTFFRKPPPSPSPRERLRETNRTSYFL